jgi:predicted DNA-binding transcriptional regulator YafY
VINEEFSVVLDAIMQRSRLAFFYPAAGKIPGERREMDPYSFANSGGEWYIAGMCCRLRAIKTFVLSRIS